MRIRKATSVDRVDVRNVYLAAFPDSEREIVAKLAVDLLDEDTTPETICLFAESEQSVVGHVAFSPVKTESDDEFIGYILAPLGIRPESQKRGVGSILVKNGIQRLSDTNADVLLVYGDPAYYGRFGFNADDAAPFRPPYELQFPFGWQGMALKKSVADRPSLDIVCVQSLSDPELW